MSHLSRDTVAGRTAKRTVFTLMHHLRQIKLLSQCTVCSVQVSSFYKMRSHFFVRRPSIEETTGPNWPKFCMGHPRGVTRGFIEGFLEIRSGDPDLGYLGSPRGGPKILKFFCLDFFIFLDGNVYLKVYIAHHSENKSFIRPF